MDEGRAQVVKAIDLFCGAGGASMGLHHAGFEVIGVDIKPQKNYPFDFIQADAMEFGIPDDVDLVWASPPCQGYSSMRHAPKTKGAPRLIPQVREKLLAIGKPYIIENVEEARCDMPMAIMLCGSMFKLGAYGCQLRRHRLFDVSFPLTWTPACKHDPNAPVVGVYGGHSRKRAASAGGRATKEDWGDHGHWAVASEAMRIGWMTLAEMSEAIPPAYAHWLGNQAKHWMKRKAA